MTHRIQLRVLLAIAALSTLSACKLKTNTGVPVTPIPSAGCQPWDCGGFPDGANTMCSDGVTEAGPTGECIAHGSECMWEVRSCPETPECELSDCGSASLLPNYLCNDNKTISGPTGRCIGQEGACRWEVLQCPANKDYCPVAECGAPLMLPNWMCANGITVAGPSGECIEQSNGHCAWEVVKCPGTSN